MNLLFKKEMRLAMHPASLGFLALSALLLVPNYPYYVTFFIHLSASFSSASADGKTKMWNTPFCFPSPKPTR